MVRALPAVEAQNPEILSRYESAMHMMEQMPLGILWLDPDRRKIGYANHRARRILKQIEGALGFPAEQAIGQGAESLLAGAPELAACLADPAAAPRLACLSHGAEVLEVTVGHVFDGAGRHCGVLINLNPITDKLARANQLKVQNRKLEAALQTERELVSLQRDFVSMVSHEFRTPLAIIDGAMQRLTRREPTGERVASSVAKVRDAVARLTELVESTLSAAQVESGAITMTLQDCDVAALLQRACRDQQEVSPAIAVRLDCDGLPERIKADPTLLMQVFSNLLSNAVKYSGDGKVVTVRGWSEPGRVLVAVRDEGVGIPAQELPKLFEQFFRASTSVGIPGTGIGLTLTRHLVELHGGTIEVESNVGQGTTFTLRLPDRLSGANDGLFTELKAQKGAGS